MDGKGKMGNWTNPDISKQEDKGDMDEKRTGIQSRK